VDFEIGRADWKPDRHAASRRKRRSLGGDARLHAMRALTDVANLADVDLTNK
jgi:hypothetical protein